MKWHSQIMMLIAMGCVGGLFGQTTVTMVDYVSNDLGLGWFHDTLKKELWLHESDGWIDTGLSQLEEVSACGVLATVRTNEGLFYGDGRRTFKEAKFLQCADSFLAAWNGYVFFFSATDSANWLRFPADRQGRCWDMAAGLDTLDGQLAACVVHHTGAPIRCEDYHQWGMMGMDGRWLIEPKFDQPFHFRDGTAEVLYYGQKRKINEKGEFVE